MKCVGVLFLMVICMTTCDAALSPQAERIREMQSILEEPNLQEMVSHEMIEALVYQPNHRYQIVTEQSIVEVVVRYLPMSYLGPTKYELKFKKPIPRPTIH